VGERRGARGRSPMQGGWCASNRVCEVNREREPSARRARVHARVPDAASLREAPAAGSTSGACGPGMQWLSVLLLAGQVALVRRLVRAGPFKARASEPSAPFGGALLLL
jgi:hypothetical protein